MGTGRLAQFVEPFLPVVLLLAELGARAVEAAAVLLLAS